LISFSNWGVYENRVLSVAGFGLRFIVERM
jgi:hypothetical protein